MAALRRRHSGLSAGKAAPCRAVPLMVPLAGTQDRQGEPRHLLGVLLRSPAGQAKHCPQQGHPRPSANEMRHSTSGALDLPKLPRLLR